MEADHTIYFDIFKVSRDDNSFGMIPVCKECIWVVIGTDSQAICRVNRNGGLPFCFKWEDNP